MWRSRRTGWTRLLGCFLSSWIRTFSMLPPIPNCSLLSLPFHPHGFGSLPAFGPPLRRISLYPPHCLPLFCSVRPVNSLTNMSTSHRGPGRLWRCSDPPEFPIPSRPLSGSLSESRDTWSCLTFRAHTSALLTRPCPHPQVAFPPGHLCPEDFPPLLTSSISPLSNLERHFFSD